jgi:hypothetical protein
MVSDPLILDHDVTPGKIPMLNHKGKIIPYTKLKKHFEYTEPMYQNYMRDWMNVYSNQYDAGEDIVDYFYEGINNVLLLAEMQSGKTGTSRYVVHALEHLTGPGGRWDSDRFTPERIYFICGMNDNDLRSQAIKEFQGFIPERNIMFSKQLQKCNHSPTGAKWYVPEPPSLVIIDESHYASFRSSQVDQFMTTARHSDLLILSVSATAMAELANSETAGTGRVYLNPGVGYYGMRDLFRKGLIKQSIDITKKQSKFIDLVIEEYEHQRDCLDLKYNIIRLPNQWYYKDLQEDLEELDLDINFINHHTFTDMSAADFNDYVRDKPACFTIIWIYGSLRAGKQLNTVNIGFVHDTSSSGPDIIAQSLMGRILGYNKEKHCVRCYTDVKAAKLMLTWVQSAYDIMKIPIGSKGIVGGYSEHLLKRNWELHQPLLVHLDSDMRSYYRSLKQQHGHRYPYKGDLFTDLALSATIDRERIIEIFETYKPGHCGGLMIMTESNKPKSFKDHWSGNFRAYKAQKLVHCCNVDLNRPGKYFYVYVNLNIESLEYGNALITYKEHVQFGGEPDRIAVRVKPQSRFSGPNSHQYLRQ